MSSVTIKEVPLSRGTKRSVNGSRDYMADYKLIAKFLPRLSTSLIGQSNGRGERTPIGHLVTIFISQGRIRRGFIVMPPESVHALFSAIVIGQSKVVRMVSRFWCEPFFDLRRNRRSYRIEGKRSSTVVLVP